MKEKRQVNTYWLLKIAVCMVFFALLAAKCEAQGLGPPPRVTEQPSGISVSIGGTAIISAEASSETAMQFTWNLNGNPISNGIVLNVLDLLTGATRSTLTIVSVSSGDVGNYSLTISNAVGSTTSSNATLLVLGNVVPGTLNILASGLGMTPNGFNLQLSGPSGSNYVIEASTDLKNWAPISTNAAPGGSISYTDTAATNFPSRYYRARLQ